MDLVWTTLKSNLFVLILNFGPILELTTLIPGYIQWTIEVRAKQS